MLKLRIMQLVNS